VPTFALNFYSPIVADQLRTGRKTATIRLGDKSKKYRKGMIVTVLVGARYGQREKVFDAVIDKVEVKPLAELSPREIEHDNPELRRLDEFTEWLGRLYNRPVSPEDTITVIRFSQIVGTMFWSPADSAGAESCGLIPACGGPDARRRPLSRSQLPLRHPYDRVRLQSDTCSRVRTTRVRPTSDTGWDALNAPAA
jgi:uncharacterized protein YqfB (UPF0267 family)